MTFVTLATRANFRICFVPELPDSTIDFAAFVTWPFTGGKLASMTAVTSMNNKLSVNVSGSWIQRFPRTSEYFRQIVMIRIGDTYDFKSITVLRVCSAKV